MWVGRILISQTETERPTPAVFQTSSSLPDLIVGGVMRKQNVYERGRSVMSSCHRPFHYHSSGFLVRFVTDFVVLEVRFNSSTCINC